MTTLARRDRLGARTIVFDPESGAQEGDLAALLRRVPAARAAGLDPAGIDAAWGLSDAPDRTCLRAFRCVPPGASLVMRDGRVHLATCVRRLSGVTSLEWALRLATERALAGSHSPIVALGGGIDAVLAVLAARRCGFAIHHAIHLSVPGTSYDESDAARETAAALDLSLHEVRISPVELAAALPRAVRLAGSLFYNLHPVSRAIVAHVARERGHDMLVTGDGADQAARGAEERADYVPLVASITRASGLALAAPFTDDELVDYLVDLHDPGKERLRELARSWGLPAAIADRAKVPCWAPPLPRSRRFDDDDDRANVRRASLDAFVRAFELETERDPCWIDPRNDGGR